MMSILASILVSVAFSAPSAYLSCSMDACNEGRTGRVAFMGVPPGNTKDGVSLRWSYNISSSLSQSRLKPFTPYMGCSSNGLAVVCSVPFTEGLMVLSYKGEKLWSSNVQNGAREGFPGGAPVVTDDGSVAVHDGFMLSAFTPDGRVVWSKSVASTEGRPATWSPSATDNNYFPIITGSGHFAIWETGDGLCWASVPLGEINQSGSFYFPSGPVSVSNYSVYIPAYLATELSSVDGLPLARLYCADATPQQVDRIHVRWWFDYNGTLAGVGSSTFSESSSSPPVTLFYGVQGNTLNLIALEDRLDKAQLLWANQSNVSSLGLLEDPRGGVWRYENASRVLIRFNVSTGNELQRLDMSAEGVPSSRGLVAPLLSDKSPTLVACFLQSDSSFMIAINLTDGQVHWRYPVTCEGQITLMDPDGLYQGGLVVTLTTNMSVIALG